MVFKSMIGLNLPTNLNDEKKQKSKTKHRSPIKIKRDILRAKLHKKRFMENCKLKRKNENEEIEAESSLEDCKNTGSERKHQKYKIWNKIKNSFKGKQNKSTLTGQDTVEELNPSEVRMFNAPWK